MNVLFLFKKKLDVESSVWVDGETFINFVLLLFLLSGLITTNICITFCSCKMLLHIVFILPTAR